MAAAARKDAPGLAAVLPRILQLGERALLMALTALSEMAVLGIKVPEGADGLMPRIFQRGTRNPVDPDDPEHAVLAFAGRFCAAAVTKDRALQGDLFAVLLAPTAQEDPDPRAERGAEALAMLAQLAAQGIARERVRRQRTHQHPNARHNGHKPHGRDRRKR